MAARPDTTTSFMAQLLAPLPADAEPVRSKRFLREMDEDAKRLWHMASLKLSYFESTRNAVASLRYRATELKAPEEDQLETEFTAAQDAYYWACNEFMLLPAPTMAALRWKRNTRAFNGGGEGWEAAIAADEARLEAS